jgi:hypothetical protein
VARSGGVSEEHAPIRLEFATVLLQLVYVSIRQHTSAYVSIRQHTSAHVPSREFATVLLQQSGEGFTDALLLY